MLLLLRAGGVKGQIVDGGFVDGGVIEMSCYDCDCNGTAVDAVNVTTVFENPSSGGKVRKHRFT